MGYEKTQYVPISVFVVIAAVLLIVAWFVHDLPSGLIVLVALAATFLLIYLNFSSLTVRDEGDWLALRYGPLPIFRKRIPYANITAVESARSSIIDGWGIHYIPGRGTTYNIWGFGCAKLSVKGKTIRIGSDDVENVVQFLRAKVASAETERG